MTAVQRDGNVGVSLWNDEAVELAAHMLDRAMRARARALGLPTGETRRLDWMLRANRYADVALALLRGSRVVVDVATADWPGDA